ncbi:MAG: GGDEF domain-containing protein [Marinomonas colpomeniae]
MFQHNKKQASKLMRSAIPLMAKLDIPPTPYNYGIWYEYSSNRSPELNQVVDRALRRFGSLPAFVSQELFSEFLLSEEFQYAHRQGPVLKQITEDLETETHSVSDELNQFQSTVGKAKQILQKSNDPKQLGQIASLLEQTAFKTNQIVEQFSQTLITAQEELAAIRAELLDAKKSTETDPLTLLANEKGFERTLFSLVPYSEDDLTLLLIDIDDLGVINQEYGKKVGTSLIRYLSKLLLGALPKGGSIARLTGGRFAMLLSETELSVASQFAEKLRHDVSIQKIRYKNSKLLLRQVTVSIGVSTLFGDESPNELIEKAQHHLVYAKRSGKNCVIHNE